MVAADAAPRRVRTRADRRVRRSLVVAALAVAASGLGACSDVGTVGATATGETTSARPSDVVPTPTVAGEATTATATTTTDATPSPPPGATDPTGGERTGGPTTLDEPGRAVIEVHDAGDEPRRALRLSPTVGTTQQLTLREEVRVTENPDGGTGAPGSGTIDVELDSAVVAADEERFTMELTCGSITSIGADGMPAPANATTSPSRAAVEDRVGCGDRLTLTRRNELVARRAASTHVFGQPPIAEPLLDDLRLVPLPDRAVGAGARWTAQLSGHHRGLPYEVTHDALLTTVDDGGVASISYSSTATVHQPRTESAGGERVEVDGPIEVSVTGQLRVLLDQPLALESADAIVTTAGSTATGERVESMHMVGTDRMPR
ncbi:MAG: hypothetical protein S0880_14740 [Actinomycetota bacterium]|nr:hypothetical protein [Actinomycetota bacterium]